MVTATKNGARTNGKPKNNSSAVEKSKLTANGILRMIPLDQLIPTPDNKRQPITDASLRSLVQSIKSNGVLQPIIVRPHPIEKDLWENRAGERRWRAAKLAGLITIPALDRAIDDETALAITLVENLQRENLHPLEEAATVQRAIAEDLDLKALASKLGRPVSYLVRRASLTNLTKVWQLAIRKADTDASRLSPAHMELIARLPATTQEQLAENDFAAVFGRGFPTVDELRRLIDGGLQVLAAMPWNPEDETLEPQAGSCTNCPKRSLKEHVLFPDLGGGNRRAEREHDRCLDPLCFQTKLVCHLRSCEGRLQAKHPSLQLVELGVDELAPAVRRGFNGRVQTVYYPHIVKASDDGAQPVMPINGPKMGKLIYLDLGTSINGRQNGQRERPRDAEGKMMPMTFEEKQARLQKRRDACVVKEVRTILETFTAERARELASPPIKKRTTNVKTLSAFECLSLLLAFGSLRRADSVVVECWDEFEKLSRAEINEQAAAALLAVIEVWARRLGSANSDHVTGQAAEAKRICDLLDLDFDRFTAGAAKTIPIPKSWPKTNGCDEVATHLGVTASES